MTLLLGTKLGPYEILAPLGAGGMGEVYRARDTRLGREVAIKVLPEAFARDSERVARFEREAKLLASLHHPNVGSIFGLEEVAGHRYLVLEFVEGETLSARLSRGALPVDEALAVCAQIAAAVEAAHEEGVIHRDLKPGNVMLKPDGMVKVLDFGLAKASAADGSSSDANLSASPTMTYAATGAGVILGTAAYMSPEQARGKAVDRRTDIWSFGCVLYECLTGRRAFEGETISDLVARILEREPDWAAVPATIQEAVRRLIRRCLTKDARERLRDIGEARIALGEARAPGAQARSAASAAPPARGVRLRTAALLAIVAAAGIALGALLPGLRRVSPDRVTRLAMLSPNPDADVGVLGTYAVSPDGRSLVFVLADSLGTDRLFIRPLEKDEAHVLEGTEGAQWPFWSPDSRDVAFFSGGRLRRIPASGGSVRTVCEASKGRGGSWGSTGVIVFAPDAEGGLAAVEASGGAPRPVTAVDSKKGESSHRFPSFLPDGRHFIFVVNQTTGRPETRVMVGSVNSSPAKPLLVSGSAAVFAAPDWVIFTRDRALLAQRVDLRGLTLVGEPRLLEDQPEAVGPIQLSPEVSCSQTGVMAYAPQDRRPTTVAWLEQGGRLTQTRVRFPALAGTAAISPDHRRLAVMVVGAEGYGNWIGNLEDGTAAQIAPPGKGVYGPLWNPAGTRLVGATMSGLRQIDPASGADSLLDVGDKLWRLPHSWSPDGATLVMSAMVEGNRYDLQTLSLRPGEKPRPYLATSADEIDGMLSHDGRWIAYESDASGRAEVYVERYPERSEAVRAGVAPSPMGSASTGGLTWRADDRELLYVGGDGLTVYAVELRTAPRLSIGAPRAIRRIPREARDAIIVNDGRVLVLLPEGSRSRSITVVHGWMNEADKKR
jgi:Tol biopolymer transport system component